MNRSNWKRIYYALMAVAGTVQVTQLNVHVQGVNDLFVRFFYFYIAVYGLYSLSKLTSTVSD